MADDSRSTIQVSAWGKDFIEKHTYLKPGDVVAMKVCKLSQFGGVSLNLDEYNSEIHVQPDHANIKKVSQWFNEEKSTAEADSANVFDRLNMTCDELTKVERRETTNNDYSAKADSYAKTSIDLVSEIEQTSADF